MSKITEKLNRILSICEPVMTADRMQNVSIEVRDIKDILRINANKTMAEVLNHVDNKKYMVVYFMDNGTKLFLDELGNKLTFENGAKVYDNIYEAGNAITRFSLSFPNSKFYIAEKKSEKYIVFYHNGIEKAYCNVSGGSDIDIKEAYRYISLKEANDAVNKFSEIWTSLKFEIEPITEPCKTKQELQEKMSSLIANGENISSEMHDKWNEFVEGESI